MSDDLVERLRDRQVIANSCAGWPIGRHGAMAEAAARIEALEAERDALQAKVDELSVAVAGAASSAFAAGFEACREMAAKAAADYTPAKHTAALASHVTGQSIQNAIRALQPRKQGDGT